MTSNDNYEPGSEVDPVLLLNYLIEKSQKLFPYPNKRVGLFPLPFRHLGAVILSSFPKLQEEFLRIVAPSKDPIRARVQRCREIFTEAMSRPPSRWFPVAQTDGNDRVPLDRVVVDRFCREARSDGEEMLRSKDFRYISIWELMVLIGLQNDDEKLRAFEQKCLQYTDPEERVLQVLPLVWDALGEKPDYYHNIFGPLSTRYEPEPSTLHAQIDDESRR